MTDCLQVGILLKKYRLQGVALPGFSRRDEWSAQRRRARGPSGISGQTGPNGEFQYRSGDKVTFTVGSGSHVLMSGRTAAYYAFCPCRKYLNSQCESTGARKSVPVPLDVGYQAGGGCAHDACHASDAGSSDVVSFDRVRVP